MKSPDKKFLILKLSSLGDVVHTLPVAHTLRKNHPNAYIAWMVEERYRDLLYQNPDLDEVIVVRTKHWRRHWNGESLREIREVIRRVRDRRFDVVLELHGLLKGGVIARVSGAPKRIGFHRRNCREPASAWFTNCKAPFVPAGTHVVDINLSLLRKVDGCREPASEFPLATPAAAEEKIRTFLESHPALAGKPVAGINPGVGFQTKQWPLPRLAALADRIAAELNFSILLTWGPGEKEMADEIASRMKERSWVAPPTDIPESIALYRRLALMVSCDSGPLHLCAALGIPTVSVFGPTDPARNGAYGPKNEVVFKVLPCSFCWKRTCPIQTHDCMEQVSVEEVFAAAKRCTANHVNLLAS